MESLGQEMARGAHSKAPSVVRGALLSGDIPE